MKVIALQTIGECAAFVEDCQIYVLPSNCLLGYLRTGNFEALKMAKFPVRFIILYIEFNDVLNCGILSPSSYS